MPLRNLDLRLLKKVAARGETEYTVLRKISRLKPQTFKLAIKRLMLEGMANRRLRPMTTNRYSSWFSATNQGLQTIKGASARGVPDFGRETQNEAQQA